MMKRETKKRVAAAILAALLASTMVAGAVLPQAYAAEAAVQEKPGNVSDALDALAKAAEEEEKKGEAAETEDDAFAETEDETENETEKAVQKDKNETEGVITDKNDTGRPGKSLKTFLIEAVVVFAAMFFISKIFIASYTKK